MKREGAGRGNWGAELDPRSVLDVVESVVEEDKAPEDVGKKAENGHLEGEAADNKAEAEEDKEMTLEEYEVVLGERRKALVALKMQERKVVLDKEFESMHLIEKKSEEDVLLKMGASDKGKKRVAENKDEKSRKPVNINNFLKPENGEGYFNSPGRRGARGGRGGRGERGGFRGGFGGGYDIQAPAAPSIEDPSHFPILGGK
ncbi:hypothetical protein KP509_01G019400 [Ceratopteris richardii]|nr:hypothetical protein KP509_01G019400 [Ceratopteris richardii]